MNQLPDPGVCRFEGCERPSCRPADYAPQCTRHYLANIRELWAR